MCLCLCMCVNFAVLRSVLTQHLWVHFFFFFSYFLRVQIERLFGIVATVIKIGNLRIERAAGNSQTSFLVRDEIAMAVASGVGMTLDELEECLCTQVTRAKKKGVDPTTACERRDAFAAALYERTVSWLLRRVNAVFEREALDAGIDAVESASHGPVSIVLLKSRHRRRP